MLQQERIKASVLHPLQAFPCRKQIQLLHDLDLMHFHGHRLTMIKLDFRHDDNLRIRIAFLHKAVYKSIKRIVSIKTIDYFDGGSMEIKNLVTFLRVAELSSFTKAAQVLDYSQSTISFQIK